MSYRPITDTWFLARCKYKNGTKYYGGYPGGFPERARALLGVRITDPVLHVCSGKVRDYPYSHAIGKRDVTLDLDPAMEPDYLQDARLLFPLRVSMPCSCGKQNCPDSQFQKWKAVLMDPPYSPEDAAHYVPGADTYPKPNQLLRNGLEAVEVGGRVGLLHYVLPQPPKDIPARFVACVSVYVGYNNRVRCYSVFERLPDAAGKV